MRKLFIALVAVVVAQASFGQTDENWKQKFEQLGTMLPTPNAYRTASGAPGNEYWQQKADYKMSITIDDSNQILTGEETITYYNQSPDNLDYLWVQLDQNMRAQDSNTPLVRSSQMRDSLNAHQLYNYANNYDGGFKIQKVTDTKNTAYLLLFSEIQ